MASINLKNKSKADLVAIVRMSGVMPISRAQRMTKAELITQLETLGNIDEKATNIADPAQQSIDEEVILQSAPGRLSARKLNDDKKTGRTSVAAERRSVFVAPDEDQKDEAKSVRRSIMNPVSAEEPVEAVKPPTRSRRTRSAMMPVTVDSDQQATTEKTSPAVTAEPVAEAPVSVETAGQTVKSPAKTTATRRKAAAKPRASAKAAVKEEVAAGSTSANDAAPALSTDEAKEAPLTPSKTSRPRTNNRRTKPAPDQDVKEPVSKEQVSFDSGTQVDKTTPVEKSASVGAVTSDKAVTADKTEDKPEREANRSQRNHARNQLKRQKSHRNGRYVQGQRNEHDESLADSQDTAVVEPENTLRTSGTTETTESSEAAGSKDKAERQSFDSGEVVSGVMEIMPDGYGFLRRDNYLQGPKDIYIPPQFIRRFNLREGDYITGPTRIQREQDRYQALYFIKEVNGVAPEQVMRRPNFDRLTPIYPDVRFKLETSKRELSTRIIDLIAPIGKGQRGMIVSPPKAGKTILLQKIANAISINNPEAKLIVLLIDERPEEVTDMQRSINGEVVYSTFDKTPENHVKITELVLERAERLVEMGQDVVILMDSLTRMARAYNLTINPTGRTLSGGLDPGALYGPKRFFGAARNIENGGSLTIVATALIDTGSRMDEVIFEEFKGTGNMEVYLDRKLSEKRIFPAIDINRSGTRREELLLSEQELEAIWSIRKAFGQLDSSNVTETIMNLLMKTNDNNHFVSSINVSLNKKSLYDTMKPNGGKN